MRSQWLVSFVAVIIVILGLGVGAYIFRQRKADDRVQQRISMIESLQAEKRYGEALQQIDALMPKAGSSERRRQLNRMAMAILTRTGDPADLDKARIRAEKYLENYPKDENLGTVHYCLGKIAFEKDGNLPKAQTHFSTVVTKYPKDPFRPAAEYSLAAIEAGSASDEVLKAKTRLEEMMARPEYSGYAPEVRAGVEDLLSRINTSMLYSRSIQEGEEFYEVKKGESPDRIARNFKIPRELLMRVNGITNPNNVRAGRRLRIPDVNFSIVVNVGDNTLTLYNNGKFFKKYPVRTGQGAGLTPTGEYKISNKLGNPTWSDPFTGKFYKAGDPENELGTRWMGFDRNPSLGIHGTIHEETVGTYASKGCIGMRKADVEELFDFVRTGTPVKIIGTTQKQKLAQPVRTPMTVPTASVEKVTSGTQKP